MADQSAQDLEKRKKRYLKRYRKNLSCIKRLEAKLEVLEAKLKTIKSPSFSGMPRGGTPITEADLIADKIDLESRIKKLKAKSRGLKNAVYDEIDSLDDPRYCEVLEAYFIDGLSFEQIADKMSYTERHIYTLYAEAISILSELPQ